MVETFKRGDVAILKHSGWRVTVIARPPHSDLRVISHRDGETVPRIMDSMLELVPAYDWRPEANRIDQALIDASGKPCHLPFYYLAIAGEVGEACNVIKKIERYGDSPDRRTELACELADVRIYLHFILTRETQAFAQPTDAPPNHARISLLQGGLWLFRETARLDAQQRSAAQGVVNALRALAAAIDVDLDAEARVKLAELYARWPHVRQVEERAG